jgi:molybdopterin-guanine dinucleotide biosynthesis adapter protein
MVTPFVFQVVGFQNSGKTTFINTLIKVLTLDNIKVATIKHHGHGGKPEVNENKDSALSIQSGAKVSVVEGDGRLILQAEKDFWGLSEQIMLLNSFQIELIIVEGHKLENYPKAVIINNENDIKLINELNNVIVVYFRDLKVKRMIKQSHPFQHFQIEELEGLQWITSYLKSQL